MQDFMINKSDSLLLIIDIQERLFQAMESDYQRMLKKNCAILFKTANEFGIPMIVTEQYRKGLGETIPELKDIIPGAKVFEKIFFDAMKEEEIKKEILGSTKKTVIVVGIEAHICVFQTALSLVASARNVVIVSDGVASRKKDDKDSAIAMLREAGALIYPTETIAFMLLEQAGTAEFKKLSPLFK
ncbi:MAG: isochorismatase family protein [Spirochaetes bacterium]|nr:isochorismatase family protein [Spirochaetota bacterium]